MGGGRQSTHRTASLASPHSGSSDSSSANRAAAGATGSGGGDVFIGVMHASQARDGMIPLTVELREYQEESGGAAGNNGIYEI